MENESLMQGAGADPELIEAALRCAVAVIRRVEGGTELVRAIVLSWGGQATTTGGVPWLIVTIETPTPIGRDLRVLDVRAAPFVEAITPHRDALREALGDARAVVGPAARQLLVDVMPRDRGRPSLSDSGESPRRNIRLPKSLDDLLIERAKVANATVSQAIRAAIEEYVRLDVDVSPACADYEHAECDGAGLDLVRSERFGQCPCECHTMAREDKADGPAPLV